MQFYQQRAAHTQGRRELKPVGPVRASLVPSQRLGAASERRKHGQMVVRAFVEEQLKTANAPMAPPAKAPAPTPVQTTKPRVVVLGSGWASMSFIKSLPSNVSESYDIVLVSPRNYFLYTPLLPAVATGTMEERSIVEPVRNLIIGKGAYYEAAAKDIDPVRKELECCSPALGGACFKIPYDILVIGVGSVNNTFGIKGVDQYCNYFKSIEDANKLRNRISECFERASLPITNEEERKKLLSFCVVGGGPTGVEVAAELHDMIYDDLKDLYPKLMQDVQIRIVELTDHLLSTYDRLISKYTEQQFSREGIKPLLNSRVVSVEDGIVNIVNKQNQVEQVKFGACVWATGVAMNPLLKALQARLPEQNNARSILTDEFFRVRGSNNSIFAFGDASTIYQPKALDHAEELFTQADINNDKTLNLTELRDILRKASQEYVHLQEHARFLDARSGGFSRFGNLVRKFLNKMPAGATSGSMLDTVDDETTLTQEQFKELLKQIDGKLRALPATAQVAKQEGEYLADLFMNSKITGSESDAVRVSKFEYFHKGSTAYVGQDMAVFDVPILGPLMGWYAGFLWKSYETFAQISLRNRVLVLTDWLRTKIFGRDISRV